VPGSEQLPCQRSEAAWLRAVVETAVDGVILADSAGVVLLFNTACERLFQFRADEVIGHNVNADAAPL
jgi:PAS domain S-box-containing protein